MLTPNQIKNHSFQYTRGGYKASEVDDYLNEIVSSYEQMFRENGELLSKLEMLAKRIEEYREDEDKIKSALITAQKAADTIITEAKNNAETLVGDATAKATELVETAQTKADSLVLEASRNSNNTLTDAENKANEVIEGAKLVADNVIAQAKQASEEIVSDAKKEVKINQEILDTLKVQASEFRNDLLEKYKTHIEFINTLPNEITKRVNKEEELNKQQIQLEPVPQVVEQVVELPVQEAEQEKEIQISEPEIQQQTEDVTLQPAEDQMTMQFTIPAEMEDVSSGEEIVDEPQEIEQINENAEPSTEIELPDSMRKKIEIKFGENYNIEDDDDQYNYENDIPPEEDDEDRSFRGLFRKKK